MQAHLTGIPTHHNLFMGRAVHPLVGYLHNPPTQLRVEVRQVPWLAPPQPTQKIAPYIFHARLDTAFQMISPRSSVPVQMVLIRS
jgi:hypothetical protein